MQGGSVAEVTTNGDENSSFIEQKVAVLLDDADGLPQRLFRPTKTFYKYISPPDSSSGADGGGETRIAGRRKRRGSDPGLLVSSEEAQNYLPSEREGYMYPHVDFMKSHVSCAKSFQSLLASNSIAVPWSKPCYSARITSDIMLRDSMALRTEVEIRILEQITKLAVMGVQVDVSPPYLEPLLIHKKSAVDHHRFKRRDVVQIPPNTSTRRIVSKDSNAQWTVRRGEVPISPNITCHFATLVSPEIIASQEALQWTFLSAIDNSFMSDRFTLPQSTSCKLEIDFVTMTLFIRVADATSGRSLEEKMKLSSVALRKYAREDLLRMEFELLDKNQLQQQEKLQRDQKEAPSPPTT